MYIEYLALNNLQWFLCNKTQPNPTKPFPSVLALFDNANSIVQDLNSGHRICLIHQYYTFCLLAFDSTVNKSTEYLHSDKRVKILV